MNQNSLPAQVPWDAKKGEGVSQWIAGTSDNVMAKGSMEVVIMWTQKEGGNPSSVLISLLLLFSAQVEQ